MADPLSITASVVGITTAALQSAQFLVKTIDNIKDAPGTIKDLNADLRVVESVLQELNTNVQDDSLQIIRSSQIGPAVENCDRACKAFQSQVERWMKHSKEDKIFWISRWKIGLFGPDRIKTFKGQLNDCKSTLNIALTTANLFVSPQKHLILLIANLLNILVAASQKDLAKEQRDSILEANEADLEQELTRAGKKMVEIEQSLQRFTVRGSTERDEESEQSKKELLQELERQQAASTVLRNICEEALSRTVYQRTGQKIKGIKAINDGVALAGFINVSGKELNISQDISDVSADNRGFVVVGVANNIDIKDLRPSDPDPPVTDPPEQGDEDEEPSSSKESTSSSETSSDSSTSSSSISSSASSSSSSSASATPTGYFIIPNYNAPAAVLDSFTKQLKAETDPLTFFISGAPAAGFITFWYQFLNSTQVSAITNKDAGASIIGEEVNYDSSYTAILPDANLNSSHSIRDESVYNYNATQILHDRHTKEEKKRATVNQYQINLGPGEDVPELAVISQPYGVPLDRLLTYAAQEEVPLRSRIYVVDSGADTSSLDYRGISPEPDWIWPDNMPQLNNYRFRAEYGVKSDVDQKNFHGSRMLSKACSQNLGVAKKAALTVVRIPEAIDNNGQPAAKALYRLYNLANALTLILEDVMRKGLFAKSVVSMSLSFGNSPQNIPPLPNDLMYAGEPGLFAVYMAMKKLIEAGVVVTVSSGNDDNYNNAMEFVPSVWSPSLSLIVVAATDDFGAILNDAKWTNAIFPNARVDVWAPGDRILGPVRNLRGRGSRSSPANAAVSGLLGYFLGVPDHFLELEARFHVRNGQSPEPAGVTWSKVVKEYVVQHSYIRPARPGTAPNIANVIYNGETPILRNCQASGWRKRDTCDQPYFIIPKYDVDPAIIDAFTAKLKAETDSTTLYISGSIPAKFVAFWYQFLNSTQVDSYRTNPAVSVITTEDANGEDTGDIAEPDNQDQKNVVPPRSVTGIFNLTLDSRAILQKREVVQYSTSYAEVKAFSQPGPNPLIPLEDIASYALWREDLDSAHVYIVDSGADTSNPAYQNQQGGEVEWIWPDDMAMNPKFPFKAEYGAKNDRDTKDNHGSCMYSKAVSRDFGISKNSRLTIVRLPKPTGKNGNVFFRVYTLVEALNRVLTDMINKKAGHRTVINISLNAGTKPYHIPPTEKAGDEEGQLLALYNTIRMLIGAGAVVVTSGGNFGIEQGTGITQIPAVWSPSLPIIVVGGTDSHFRRRPDAQWKTTIYKSAMVDIWAPGNGECAFFSGHHKLGGSSQAAASISGFVAYFMSDPRHYKAMYDLFGENQKKKPTQDAGFLWSETVKEYIRNFSYARTGDGSINVPYNGEMPMGRNNQLACQASAPKRFFGKRDVCPRPPDIANPGPWAASAASYMSSVDGASSTTSKPTPNPTIIAIATQPTHSSTGTLPSLTKQCYTSSLVNCKWIQSPASRCPTTTEALPSACSAINPALIIVPIPPQDTDVSSSECFSPGGGHLKIVIDLFNMAIIEFCRTLTVWYESTAPGIGKAHLSQDQQSSLTINLDQIDQQAPCNDGVYPRLFGAGECKGNLDRIRKLCPYGGSLIWRDRSGCIRFGLQQVNALLPTSTTPTSAVTPIPTNEPFIVNTQCWPSTAGYLAIDKKLSSTAIDQFCSGTFIWNKATDAKIARTQRFQDEEVSIDMNVDHIDQKGPCIVGTYPRELGSGDCDARFKELRNSCPWGGSLIWQSLDGCVVFNLLQIKP